MQPIIENHSAFKEAYIRLFLTWHASRYESWLTVLNILQSSSQGSKSAARAQKLLSIEKVIMAKFAKFANEPDKIRNVKDIQQRYLALKNRSEPSIRHSHLRRHLYSRSLVSYKEVGGTFIPLFHKGPHYSVLSRQSCGGQLRYRGDHIHDTSCRCPGFVKDFRGFA